MDGEPVGVRRGIVGCSYEEEGGRRPGSRERPVPPPAVMVINLLLSNYGYKLVSKGLLSSIDKTCQPYVNSGIIRHVLSPQSQACSPSHETHQFSRVLDDSDWVYNIWRLKTRRLFPPNLFGTHKRVFVTLLVTYLQTDRPFLAIHSQHA